MALRFDHKIGTLLALHKGQAWLKSTALYESLATRPQEGFFYMRGGSVHTVKLSTVKRSLRDAHFWLLLEFDNNRSRLTDYGRQAKKQGLVDPPELESALADILEVKTGSWDPDNSLDVDGFCKLVSAVPNNLLPSADVIFKVLSKRHPKLFQNRRLSNRRTRQLLAMLSYGTGSLVAISRPLYLHPKDSRAQD